MSKSTFALALTYYIYILNISIKQAAKEFKTAPGTITRWMNAYSAPALPGRLAIIAQLRKRYETQSKAR